MFGGTVQAVGQFVQTVSGVANYGRTSPTGAVWTDRTIASGARDVAYNGTIYCAVRNNQDTYTSTDGITWTAHAAVLPAGAWTTIVWGNNQFLAFKSATSSNVAATSPDGIVWTARTLSFTDFWVDAIWNGTVWVAVSTSGGTTPTSIYSMDGITWANSPDLPGVYGPGCIGWNGNVFVGVATDGRSFTSPNGINWNINVGFSWFSQPIPKLVWNGTIFVGALVNGSTITTIDGLSWTVTAVNNVFSGRGLAWNGSTFCIAGDNSGNPAPYTGSDGTTWVKGTNFTGASQGNGMSGSYLVWGSY